LLWVRRSTAERPSPLRVCSDLGHNTLTGSVPSSLSALTNLELLCVPPSCHRRLRVRPRVGSVGSAPSRAACRGAACRGHRARAVRQQGCCGALRREPCTRCDYGVLNGHRSYGLRCAGTGRGTWLLRVRRSTAERPSPLRACSKLYNNKLTGSVPSSLSALTELVHLCVPPSLPTAFTRAADVRRIGRLCSERAACRGLHVGGIEWGRCGSRVAAVLSDGNLACDVRDVTTEYSTGTPPMGYGARVPEGAHGCCGCGAVPPSERVRFGCADTSPTIS
jgi:hypothetical protein